MATQAQVVRDTINHFGGPESPQAKSNQDLAAYILERYNITVAPGVIGTYKSNMKKADREAREGQTGQANQAGPGQPARPEPARPRPVLPHHVEESMEPTRPGHGLGLNRGDDRQDQDGRDRDDRDRDDLDEWQEAEAETPLRETKTDAGFTREEIMAIKAVVKKYGRERVIELTELLSD